MSERVFGSITVLRISSELFSPTIIFTYVRYTYAVPL
nr:MAG TPA: hypothetical protein [Caudoviricetes sp.]